jgi:hypothetical protein
LRFSELGCYILLVENVYLLCLMAKQVETEEKLLERIVMNPKVMGGKPVVKGTRITVEQVLKLLAQSLSTKEILRLPAPNKRRHCCSAALRCKSGR